MPHLVLIGGMIDQRLYTRNGIQSYIKMASLDDLRAQLVASLNLQLASLSTTISTPVSNLSQALTQHTKQDSTSSSSAEK